MPTLHPTALLHSTPAAEKHECEKRRNYEQQEIKVEHVAFTSLVLCSSGGWEPSATVASRD